MRKLFLLLGATVALSSCATVFTGTKDTITFRSDPSGATVYKDGIELCRTPCTVPISRDINSTEIEYRLDGYESRIFVLDQEFNVVSIINLGNVFGWAIDVLTGAVMVYDRKTYDLQLDPDTRAMLSSPREIHINSKEGIVDFYVTR